MGDEPKELVLEFRGGYLFAILDGKEIAKRGRGAKEWTTLIPGWTVREVEDAVEVIRAEGS
jgi:hypothetical protein